jgi:hypothetical protein
MKFPARAIAIAVWLLAVVVAVIEWLSVQRALHQMPQMDDTYYLVLRVGAALSYFAGLFGLGAIVWLLGEIRDRLAERR